MQKRLDVPFYPMTHRTINYCGQLLLESVFKYYKNKEYPLSHLGKISKKFGKGYTLTVGIALAALKKGLKVWYMTKSKDFIASKDVDYERFYGKEGAEVVKKAKGIFDEATKLGLKTKFEKPTLNDLRKELSKGNLVICLINYGEIYRALVDPKIDRDIYHFVLLTGYDNNNFYFHDVGLNNPLANQIISNWLFYRAWSEKGTDMDTLIYSR
jgi:hypothetical protein